MLTLTFSGLTSVVPSGSVAVTAAPMFVPVSVFSAMERVAVAVANAGASLTFVMLMVTSIEAVSVPSETCTVTL